MNQIRGHKSTIDCDTPTNLAPEISKCYPPSSNKIYNMKNKNTNYSITNRSSRVVFIPGYSSTNHGRR